MIIRHMRMLFRIRLTCRGTVRSVNSHPKPSAVRVSDTSSELLDDRDRVRQLPSHATDWSVLTCTVKGKPERDVVCGEALGDRKKAFDEDKDEDPKI